MIVQIIGLPCTGKTTLIKQYLKTNQNISYIDLANFKEHTRYKDCIKQVQKSRTNVIVESACGLAIKQSIVILYRQPINTVYARHILRGETLDEDYLSLLTTQMVKPNYTVTSEQSFNSTLDLLFY